MRRFLYMQGDAATRHQRRRHRTRATPLPFARLLREIRQLSQILSTRQRLMCAYQHPTLTPFSHSVAYIQKKKASSLYHLTHKMARLYAQCSRITRSSYVAAAASRIHPSYAHKSGEWRKYSQCAHKHVEFFFSPYIHKYICIYIPTYLSIYNISCIYYIYIYKYIVTSLRLIRVLPSTTVKMRYAFLVHIFRIYKDTISICN